MYDLCFSVKDHFMYWYTFRKIYPSHSHLDGEYGVLWDRLIPLHNSVFLLAHSSFLGLVSRICPTQPLFIPTFTRIISEIMSLLFILNARS